jgi:hypothetical protein
MKRLVDWGVRSPFFASLVMFTIVVVAGLAAVTHEGRQRADDLRREQIEDSMQIAKEQAERDAAIVNICQTLAARVELTFQETYDVLEDRAAANGRPAPLVYAELSLIAGRNLNPAFCSPPALEGSTTTSP